METGDETDELHEIISGASQANYSIGNEDAKKSEILKFLLDPADSNFSFETALNPSSSSTNSISNNSISQSPPSTTSSSNSSQPSQSDQQMHQQQQQQQQQQPTNQGQSNPVFKVPRPPKKKV